MFLALVVDDSRDNRKHLTSLIKVFGYNAENVSSGEEAVDRVRDREYGIVMMDYEMGGIDGLEATRRIRQFNRTIPIYLITAKNIEEQDWRAAGASGFLYKLSIDLNAELKRALEAAAKCVE